MKITKLAVGLFLFGALLAGCSGGGGGGPAAQPGPGPTPDPGPQPAPAPAPVVSTTQVQDQLGNTVTANFSSALAVNDANQVIGFAETTAGATFTAALWSVDPAGTMTVTPSRLAPIAGNTFSAAFAVDAAGSAVGQSAKGALEVAVIWKNGSSVPTELVPLAASGNSAAYGISAAGDLVVGEAQNASGVTRAVIWVADAQGSFAGRAPIALPVTLFATNGASSQFSSAMGVARVGSEIWVVGEVEDGAKADHAALWTSSDGAVFTAIDLRRSPEVGSAAVSVNANGIIVGSVETSNGVFAPASWARGPGDVEFTRTNLSPAGSAVAIHSSGRAAGWTGSGPLATVWGSDGTAVTVFTDASRAYGVNGTLVVGQHGSAGFVKRLE